MGDHTDRYPERPYEQAKRQPKPVKKARGKKDDDATDGEG